MESEFSEEMPPALPPTGWAAWRILVWAVLTLFVINSWAIWQGLKTTVLAFEVPSHAALANGHIWTLLTYALTGAGTGQMTQWISGPLSIFFLWVLAQLAEAEMSRRDFIWLCVACALGGVACWLPFHWVTGDALLSGCMVLVPGLLAFWCFAMPDEPLPLKLFFTFEVRPQAFFWLVLALETGSFLSFELPQALGHPGAFTSPFDNSAHLGAMIAGWVFACVWRRNLDISELPPAAEKSTAPASALPAGVNRAIKRTAVAQQATVAGPARPMLASQRELRDEVDRILDKINRQGFGALDAQEKQTLDRAKNLLKK
jgi:membrane associated rhomboid family serine protease